MARPLLEVADILNRHGGFVARHRGHLNLGQIKVMSAIRACRTAALGGHVARCTDCDHTVVSYNSCRNRHCPKCQGAAARQWLADREADLLPVPYYHVVFTLPAAVADIAFQNPPGRHQQQPAFWFKSKQVAEAVLSRRIKDLEPRLTRNGYDLRCLVEQFDVKPAEVRRLLRGELDAGRTVELLEEMRAAGLPT